MERKSKMKTAFIRFIMILSIIIVPLKAVSETPEEYRVKDSHLNFEAAKSTLTRIETALKDYRDFSEMILTDEVLDKLKTGETAVNVRIQGKDLKGLSTINWSIQNIGFNNWVIILRGTLLKSAYLTKKFEYELAKCKGGFSEKELTDLKKAASDSFEEYQKFLSKATYTD
jgi:predicted DNA binding CopG/RHH family protein